MSTASDFPADFERIIEVLNRHRVRYLVIGGVAAMLHGALIRTLDLDVTPSNDDKNKRSLARALKELEAELRAPGLDEGIEIPLDARTFTGMVTMTFITRFGPLDVCFVPDGTTGYEDLSRSASRVEVEGLSIPVASLSDIIRSKRAAGREKDAEHLEILTRMDRDP